jgi:hypothetical protein
MVYILSDGTVNPVLDPIKHTAVKAQVGEVAYRQRAEGLKWLSEFV